MTRLLFLFLLLVLAFPAFAQPTSWTTQARPNPVDGMIGFNTTLGYLETYSASAGRWYPVSGLVGTVNGTKSFDVCGTTFSGAQAKCDLRTFFSGAQWSAGSNTLNIGSTVTTSATVTAPLGGKQLTITGSQPYGSSDIGKPLWVPGPSGTGWLGTIDGFVNSGGSQTVAMSTRSPISLTSQTVSLVKDYIFNCGSVPVNGIPPSVGQTVEIPQTGAGQNAWSRSTIASCISPNQVTTTVAAPAWTNPTTTLTIRIYTDDSTAFNNAVTAALSRQAGGDRTIYVSRSAGVPFLTEPAALTIFVCEHDVTIWKPLGQSSLNFQKTCLYPDAPSPIIPPGQMPVSALATAGTAGAKINVGFLGASTFCPVQSPIPGISTFTPVLLNSLVRANGDMTFVPFNRCIGGQNFTNYDSTPSSFPAWYAVHGNSWLSYVQADSPDLLFIEVSANEGLSFSTASFFDVIGKILAWPKVPSIVFSLDDEYSIASGVGFSGNFEVSGDYSARPIRAFCEIYGWGCVDFRSYMVQLRDGLDRRSTELRHWVPDNPTVNTPWFATLPDLPDIQDWAIRLVYAGNASAFCTAAGGEIRFAISGNLGGGVYSKNIARFGCDSAGTLPGSPGAGATYFQVDVDQLHPGVGGAPLIPTAVDNWTVSGGNTLTAATLTPFTAQHVGTVITIPNAGGSGQPCITTISAFTSSSVVTIAAGCTNGTYNSQGLFFGNPRTFTQYTYTSDATGTFRIEFSQTDTQCMFMLQGLDVYTWTFPCAAYGDGPFHPQITTATNISNNGLTIDTELAGQYRLYLGFPKRVQALALDDSIVGGAHVTLGDDGTGECGGSGGNHAGCRARMLVYDPVSKAIDWRIPRNGQFRATPTTGTTVTIPSRTIWTKLTPAGTLATLTVVLPPKPLANEEVQITSTQIVTTLTVNPSAGQSVVGAPSTIAANGVIAFRWDQQSSAWTRTQ